MAANPIPKISFDEYLKLEETATFKSEYRGGEILAMAGGTPEHSRLSIRMVNLLDQIKGGCVAYDSNLKIYAQAIGESMYPDASLVCGNLEYHEKRRDVIVNPSVIVEVLSPSTRSYDLGEKASYYRTMPSVETLIFVDSQRFWVQRQDRGTDNWTLTDSTKPEHVVWRNITVAAIYEGIELPTFTTCLAR